MAKIKVKDEGSNATTTQIFDVAFGLAGFGKDKGRTMGVVILPELTDARKVAAAWTEALHKTAKALEVPDYKAAAEYMMKNNPGWVASHTEEGSSIGYNDYYLKK